MIFFPPGRAPSYRSGWGAGGKL